MQLNFQRKWWREGRNLWWQVDQRMSEKLVFEGGKTKNSKTFSEQRLCSLLSNNSFTSYQIRKSSKPSNLSFWSPQNTIISRVICNILVYKIYNLYNILLYTYAWPDSAKICGLIYQLSKMVWWVIWWRKVLTFLGVSFVHHTFQTNSCQK